MLGGIPFILLEPLRLIESEYMFYAAGYQWLFGPLLVLSIECVKLVVAVLVVLFTTRNFFIRDIHRFVVPAILCVAGGLAYFEALKWFTVPILATLLNLRLPVSVMIRQLNEPITTSGVTLLGLFFVSFGTIYSQMRNPLAYDDVWAIFMCIFMAACWSAAPNLTKRMLKTPNMPFWDQQLRLSIVGVLASLVYVWYARGDLVRTLSENERSTSTAALCVLCGAAASLASWLLESSPSNLIGCMSHAIVSIVVTAAPTKFRDSFPGGKSTVFVDGLKIACIGAAIYAFSSINARKVSEPEILPTKNYKMFIPMHRRLLFKRIFLLCAVYGLIRMFSLFYGSNLSIENRVVRRPSETTPREPLDFTSKHLCFVDPRDVEYKTANLNGSTVLDAIEEECRLATPLAMKQCKVPNVVHLIALGGTYKFFHYLAVKAIYEKIKPDAIFIHGYDFPMNQEYFRKIYIEFDPLLVYSRKAESIYEHSVNVVEHRSDLVRIESMIRFGGMYFDLDVFVLKDMKPFMDSEAVMGEQPNRGINSGMLIGKRCARFFRRWHGGYSTFDDNMWDVHAIVVPINLYRQDRRDLRLEGDALRNVWHSMYIFDQEYNPAIWKPMRAIHSFYRDYGVTHNATDVKDVDNNFGRFARNLLYGGPALGE